MVDYKNNLSRSLYSNDTRELTEIVNSDSGKDVYTDSEIAESDSLHAHSKDTYFGSFKNNIETRLKTMKDAVIENKAANLASLGGLAVSLVTNYLSGTYAGDHHFTYSGVDWTSFICEALPHGLTSAAILYTTYKNQGLSKSDIWKNMAILGALTTALSLGAYKPLRDVIANNFMDVGNPAGLATLKAQLSLMTEYVILSSTLSYFTLKMLGRLPKDLKDREKRKAEILDNMNANLVKMNESNSEVKKTVDTIIDDYVRQNPARRKNGSAVIDSSDSIAV